MPDLGQLPRALRERVVFSRIAGDAQVPALLAHPDEGWAEPGASPTPRPVVIWMHGRTVSKEIDPGRYLRWLRAGIATCAIDLPGHGERIDRSRHTSNQTLAVIEECIPEIDAVFESLKNGFNGAFDTDRAGIGGMSAGGMVTLARLCSEHPFKAAAVESTAGDFRVMKGHPFFDPDRVQRLNPIDRIEGWRDIPLLALHSESDEWVPVAGIRNFIEALAAAGKDRQGAELVTWPETGAPSEHAGFGKVSNEAKTLQTNFFARTLGA